MTGAPVAAEQLGLDAASVTSLRRSVSAWSARTRRDLPWRRTRDPWAVLVSELMLAQTQVARVERRWPDFLVQFPDPASCAVSPVGAVIAAWVGLGYNRRAVNLHRCATKIVEQHGGEVPSGVEELGALPGVGPYTARAVMAFAFERRVGVVDTNVGRVLARVRGAPLGRADAQSLADELVPRGRGWAWNQAMLDLGATRCRSREPRCDECPASRWCRWCNAGRPEPDPAVGSAGVSGGQSRFQGSDRQGRGRLIDTLATTGLVDRTRLGAVAGWPEDPERVARVVEGLVRDGLAVWSDGETALSLPVDSGAEAVRR